MFHKKEAGTAEDKKDDKPGHINEYVYAAGASGLWGLVAGAAVAVAAFAVFYFGRKDGNYIDKTGTFIEKSYKAIEGFIAKAFPEKIREELASRHEGKSNNSRMGVALGMAGILFAAVSHIVPIPAFVRALKKAKSVNAVHDDALATIETQSKKIEELESKTASQETRASDGSKILPESKEKPEQHSGQDVSQKNTNDLVLQPNKDTQAKSFAENLGKNPQTSFGEGIKEQKLRSPENVVYAPE